MLHARDLIEPEETVGNLWHDWASRLGTAADHDDAAITLTEVRTAAAMFFRALGGAPGVEVAASPAAPSGHRLRRLRRLGTAREMAHVAAFDGARLRLPPRIAVFPQRGLNRAAYLWLAALAAAVDMPGTPADALAADLAEIAAMSHAADRVYRLCPGLRDAYGAMCRHILATRRRPGLPSREAAVEAAILDQLGGPAAPPPEAAPAPRRYRRFQPVPIWLRLPAAGRGGPPAADGDDDGTPPGLAATARKAARREERDQSNRRDNLIVHRFESILSWAESLNLNRMTDDDDQDNAAKAADDQDHLTLSPHHKRAATRLRIHLDLAPQDADHERIADRFTYPEWNNRTRSYLPDHTRVLEAEPAPGTDFIPDPRLIARVRRQFEALHPRRVTLPRQLDGADLDLDATVAAQTDLRATGACSDRIHAAHRASERDLAVAILMDCSRSTEAVVGDRPVIDTAREALAALAGGIDSAGDRLAIWGFSSLRRDRVFLHRCKDFDQPMSGAVTGRIGGLRPGHYTRLGAAIRHASAQLDAAGAARRLLLVLTDGKPNDMDHYEGAHGIEDSRMAVREARALGQAVHGVIVDADGRDWFGRIFGRAGFTLLPDPVRLPRALPEIYQHLTRES